MGINAPRSDQPRPGNKYVVLDLQSQSFTFCHEVHSVLIAWIFVR
jgi:hypothetical protein